MRAACLLAGAWLALGCGVGLAQNAFPDDRLVDSDPLAPARNADPNKAPGFEKSNRPLLKPVDAPRTLTPPPSGAGLTGFDSSNTGDRTRRRRQRTDTAPNDAANVNANANANALAPPLGAPQSRQQPVSPYQVPPTETAQDANPYATPDDNQDTTQDTQPDVLAQAPGSGPVRPIGPIRQPPKKRREAEQDPYEALGIHAGSFYFYPALEVYGGYDTNPQQVSDGKGAWLYTVAPELRVQSNWSRHELKADLRGSYTGYNPDTDPTLSRPQFEGRVDGRYDVTSQTRIEMGGRALVSTDNPGSPNVEAGLAKLPLYATFGPSLGLGHRFNRLDLSIKGDFERTVYQDSELTDGTTASNEDRNLKQYGGTLRAGYELRPGITPFAEARLDERVHDLEFDSSGYQRNSKGITGKLGTTFELTRQLTGEIALGYTKRTYDDPRLEDVKGLIGDASLIWTASALTTVKLAAASSVGESTEAGVSGVLYRDVGLQVDHAFRRWLIGTVKAGFGLDDYVGDDREDRRYSLGAGVTYKVNRTLQIKGEFRQEWLKSNVDGNDYTASIFLLGVRLQR